MTKLKLVVATSSLALGSALVTALIASHLRPQGSLAPAEARQAKVAPAAFARESAKPTLSGAYRLEAGKRYIYAFHRDVLIGGLSNEIPKIAFDGEFYVDVIRKVDAQSFDAVVSEKLGAGPSSDVALGIRVERGGAVLKIQSPDVPGETQMQHLNILKDLVSQWLFPLEKDTVGAYQASFAPAERDGSGWLQKKRKLTYLRTAHDSVVPEIVYSEHQLEWNDSQGVALKLTGRESTRLGVAEPAASVASRSLSLSTESSYSLAFNRTEASKVSDKDAHRISGAPYVDSLELASAARGARSGSPSAWEHLSARLADLSSLGKSAQLALFGDLAHELKDFPESISRLMALLTPAVIQSGTQSALFKMAVGALATAGTPEAQAQLMGIYNDPNCPVDGKGSILSAFTTTQAPIDPQIRDTLLQISQNESNQSLAQGAAFALGSALQSAGPGESTDRAIAAIQLAGQNSNLDQRTLLDVMGNSGRSEFLPEVAEVIQSDADPALRSKAVYSLRFMNNPQASALLSQSLSDPDPGVRLAAANAIQIAPWSPTYVTPLSKCSSGETVSAVQTACQTALHRAM